VALDEDPNALEHKPKDRWLDQWLVAKGEPLKRLVASTTAGLLAHEKHTAPRERRRREKDHSTFEKNVEILTCNLAYAVLNPPETGLIAYRRGKDKPKTRYDNRPLSQKVYLPVIEDMAELLMVSLNTGNPQKGLSTIAPRDWFARRVRDCGVSFGDFGRDPNEEVIILSRKKTRQTDFGPRKDVALVDYEDCREADLMREEVRSLNRFLEAADIDFEDDSKTPVVDPHRRTLTRRFSVIDEEPQRFDKAGRLFGPWWMNLKKERRGNIRIQGEPIAELDFSNMFARLGYQRSGAEAPTGDLYDLSGLLQGYERRYRAPIKIVVNALFFGAGQRLPRGLKAHLPKGSTMGHVRKAIEAKHPALKSFLGTDVGFHFMFQESMILVEVLKRLQGEGVVGLGLHDAILVPQSKADIARAIMSECSIKLVGTYIPIEIKPHV
jgi:hypothetical protein